MKRLRVAVVGAGVFGRNHVRAIAQNPEVELTGVVDLNPERALAIAAEFHTHPLHTIGSIAGKVDAAIVATPTLTHEALAIQLLESGIDVLVEKPIADSAAAGERLAHLAKQRGRILQVGHLERFNPAVSALQKVLTVPLFFEVHRLSIFTPRSLDIDVVLDLMIHDLDIVLSFTGEFPSEIRAAGISVLSKKVDIANVRLAFPSGCIANLTASRVSTEKVRKLRIFQPGEYISLDYARQDATRLAIKTDAASPLPKIGFESLAVEQAEPLQLELASFFQSVRDRSEPLVNGSAASAALKLAEAILEKIEEQARIVAATLQRHAGT